MVTYTYVPNSSSRKSSVKATKESHREASVFPPPLKTTRKLLVSCRYVLTVSGGATSKMQLPKAPKGLRECSFRLLRVYEPNLSHVIMSSTHPFETSLVLLAAQYLSQSDTSVVCSASTTYGELPPSAFICVPSCRPDMQLRVLVRPIRR